MFCTIFNFQTRSKQNYKIQKGNVTGNGTNNVL